MRSYHEQLQMHALKDLANRAKSGILMYLTVFLVLAYAYDLQEKASSFFLINVSILAVIAISRITHFVTLNSNSSLPVSLLNQWLVITVLIAALHWGMMTAWIIYDPALIELKYLSLILAPAFALGASCTLSISSEIRMLYPTLMFSPIVAMLIYQGTTENLVMATLITFSLLYIFSATRATHNDYWEAITNRMVAEERAELMEKLSTTDQLTQLKNRMYFDSEYTQEWKRCSRMKSYLSVIMIDLDFFKHINDTYGHMYGDDVLRKVADVIGSETKRPTDCAARYGGEEFVVLLPNTDQKGTQVIANRILNAISELRLKADGKPLKITCSIGGTTCIPDYKHEKSVLIKEADEALYFAKNTGRAKYVAFGDIPVDNDIT